MSQTSQTQKIGLSVVGLPKTVKKKREPTFTNNEKRILIMLAEKHFAIIECKKTDALSSRAKHNEWALITNEFNATNDHIPRDAHALRTLWDNLKKKAKQTMTIINSNRYATGGGPPNEPKEDPNIDKVISLIKTNVQGFSNIYDSDSISLGNEDCNATLLNTDPVFEITVDYNNGEHSYATENCDEHSYAKQDSFPFPNNMELVNGNWESYTPGLLRTPRAKVLLESQKEAVEEESTTSDPRPPQDITSEGGERKRQKLDDNHKLSIPKSTRHLTSRRRPVLKESEAVALATTKIKTLQSSVEQSRQEHEIAMRCLLLQEEQEKEKLEQEKEKLKQEKEKLKQEQEKTEQEVIKKKLLLAELEKLTNSVNNNYYSSND